MNKLMSLQQTGMTTLYQLFIPKNPPYLRILLMSFIATFMVGNVQAYAPDTKNKESEECKQNRQFTFSWSMLENCDFMPRGGTTRGAKITLDPNEHPGWRSLQEPGLTKYEKDRRAILAMAGPYRVSFDFLEVAGYVPGFEPDRPYQSWGTEYVYVVEDRKDFISLQHIMVMIFEQDDGSVSEPFVMKHWRQDWQYQKPSILQFDGDEQWQKVAIPADEISGSWAQSVYQVDDSPRYESWGQWQHHANYSTWVSTQTWRPLPRRESSVRDDYQVLLGTNRHSIVPTGWIQEEQNDKTVLKAPGELHESQPFLSRELGIARYERIVDHDFSPSDIYWKKTSDYWAAVREVWKNLIADNTRLTIRKRANDQYLFQVMFNEAHIYGEGGRETGPALRQAIRSSLDPFIEEMKN